MIEAATADVTGSIRIECGYVGATNQRKCGADPTRDVDPRVVEVEEVQGQLGDESDEEEPLIPQDDDGPDADPSPDDGEAEVLFQQIFQDIVHDDDELPAAPYFEPLFGGGLEANSPGPGDEIQDHDDFPVAIPEPTDNGQQQSQHNGENAGASAIQQPLAGESSGIVEQPNTPHLHHARSRDNGGQDTVPESPQQVPSEVEQHGQRLAGLAAALQDLSLGVARTEPVISVERLAEGIASALTIGLIPDDQGISERLEHLAVQTRGLSLQDEPGARASLLRAATHAEGLESLVANAPAQRPASHRRTLSDTTPTLDRNLPDLQVWEWNSKMFYFEETTCF